MKHVFVKKWQTNELSMVWVEEESCSHCGTLKNSAGAKKECIRPPKVIRR